ncbi:MAG TPA: hypothetical protein VIU61_30670, partial [Kofleriaceae bacterium]
VRSANTSEDFVTSGGKGWRVVPPTDASAAISAEAKRDLAAGYAIVLGPNATWWRVHPASGETLGMSARGGSVTTERAMMDNLIIFGLQAGVCLYQDLGRAGGAASPHTRSYWFCIASALVGFGGSSAVVAAGGGRGLSMVINILNALFPITGPRSTPT